MSTGRDGVTPTRWSLIRQLKKLGDQQSWREFFDTCRQLISGNAIRSGITKMAAQSLAQDAVISVWRRVQGFPIQPEAPSLAGALLQQTHRRALDQIFPSRAPAWPRSENAVWAVENYQF